MWVCGRGQCALRNISALQVPTTGRICSTCIFLLFLKYDLSFIGKLPTWTQQKAKKVKYLKIALNQLISTLRGRSPHWCFLYFERPTLYTLSVLLSLDLEGSLRPQTAER